MRTVAATAGPAVRTVAATAGPAVQTVAATVHNVAVSTASPNNGEGTLELEFRLNQQFTEELSDQNSQAFNNLSKSVTTEVCARFK